MKYLLLEKDKVQKKWKNFPIDHGIYLLEFDVNEMQCSYLGDANYICANSGPIKRIDLPRNLAEIFVGASKGNIRFNQNLITIIGRFRKSGTSIFFDPLQENINERKIKSDCSR
jgi:hypothetical protein